MLISGKEYPVDDELVKKMFVEIRNAEIKNSKSKTYDDSMMVKRIISYISKNVVKGE